MDYKPLSHQKTVSEQITMPPWSVDSEHDRSGHTRLPHVKAYRGSTRDNRFKFFFQSTVLQIKPFKLVLRRVTHTLRVAQAGARGEVGGQRSRFSALLTPERSVDFIPTAVDWCPDLLGGKHTQETEYSSGFTSLILK